MFGCDVCDMVGDLHQFVAAIIGLDDDALPRLGDMMLEAHDYLIRADQRNLAKFKDLTQFLRENVTKHAADAPPAPPSPRPPT